MQKKIFLKKEQCSGHGQFKLTARGKMQERGGATPWGSHPRIDERVQDPTYGWRDGPFIGGETLPAF